MNPEPANPEEEKPSVTLPGTVEKIIPALGPNHPCFRNIQAWFDS